MSSKLILCADGGATSTKLALIEKSSGKVIKKYTGGPLYFTGDKKQGLLNLHKIIQQISDKNAIEHSIVGVSGIDTENELAEAKKIFTAFFNKFIANSKVIVVNDIQLVLHNTKSKTKNKIAIIAGTGSNCVGTDGKVLKKAGGLGYLLTDQGSGYHIGYTALKKYVKSKDKRGEKSKILEEEIESFFSVKSHIELKDIIYSETFLKKDIAAITPLVVKCANDNDKLCSKILDTAGKT
jgi:N-acetylglucosamine kinase-like BadF-type ATPase